MKRMLTAVLMVMALGWLIPPAQGTITVTNLNEDFADISDWPNTFGTPPFSVGLDGGRTIISATNTATSILDRRNFTPVDAAMGPLAISVVYRERIADPTPPLLHLQRNPDADPIVAGSLAEVLIFPRGTGTLEFHVFRYTDSLGTEEEIVNVATNQTFPVFSYFTLSFTRTNGVWQGVRSDTSAIMFTATESTLATGGLLGEFEIRDQTYAALIGGLTLRYFDNLLITSTADVPEPATGLLLGLGGLVTWGWRRRK